MSRIVLGSSVSAVIALFISVATPVFSQSTSDGRFISTVLNMQSEDVKLPEDFLVRVDNDRLQVAMESFGLIDKNVPKSNLLVHLISSQNQVASVRTNQDGVAEFEGVAKDTHYAIVVAEQSVHAAIPVMTVSEPLADKLGVDNRSLRVHGVSLDGEEILTTINRDLPPIQGPTGELAEVARMIPEKLSSTVVQLQQDGSLQGRVVVLDRELARRLRYAKLNFYQNQQLITRTDSTPEDGSFSIPNINPGVYQVLAAGPAGYASFAFNVLPFNSLSSLQSKLRRAGYVSSLLATPANSLCVCLIPPRMIDETTKIIKRSYSKAPDAGEALAGGMSPSPSPFSGFGGGGGGFGGGGFGGGGGGGGFGGGIGGLGGLAGLGALVAIIADDDDDPNNVVSPITTQTNQ